MDFHSKTGQQGFTLIEVLIVMVILGFGVLGVASMQTSATLGNATARQITEANNLAAAQIELFMTLDYGDDLLQPAADPANPTDAEIYMPDDTDNDGTPDNDALDGAPGYTISWVVAATDPADPALRFPITDAKRIEITVAANRGKNPRTVRRTYYKANL